MINIELKKFFFVEMDNPNKSFIKKIVKKILLQKNLIKMKDLALKLQFYHVH